LETNNHLLNAHIQVENEQAKLLVEKNLNELHTQLQESGVELNSLNISMGYSSKQEKSFQQKSKQKIDYSDSTIEEINNKKNETKSLGYNTYEYLA
jgi:flagellar hook-length control protein FliK